MHQSDSVFCQRHRWKVGLLHLVDAKWRAEALPEDDLVLPEGHEVNVEEDEKAEDGPPERWCELPLTHFLEEEAAYGSSSELRRWRGTGVAREVL